MASWARIQTALFASACLLCACTKPDAAISTSTLHIGDRCRADQGWQPDAGPQTERDAQAHANTRSAFPPIGTGTCGLWPDAPSGYFTARCETDADCPDHARCGLGSHWCVARCRSNADCTPPASCHLSGAAAISYCQVIGGVLGQGDRDAGASDDCELPCGFYQTCCHAECFDLANDPLHCGTCTHACSEDAPYCEDGHCMPARCDTCTTDQTCCAIYGATGPVPTCLTLHPNQPCPPGCHDCSESI